MTATDFITKTPNLTLEKGSITCQAPSNIALVKYWGKKDIQIPQNTSISFTLSHCKTTTTLNYVAKANTSSTFDFEVYLDGQRQKDFEPKIAKFFERISTYVPFLKQYIFKIETSNSFPHSSGIASSASGLSALALCLTKLESKLIASAQVEQNNFEDTKISSKFTDEYFAEKTSFLARLGSGSAARSTEGPMMIWGRHNQIEASSNLFAVKHDDIHSVFKDYQDTILLIDKGEKQVSSTVGHDLMHNHPFAKQRFEQAQDNMVSLLKVLKNGDLNTFITIVESEALTLHAMMMTSHPYFVLMKPNTLQIINKIWAFRKATNLNLCFTLDAGANVHLLYPKNESEQTLKFIKEQLATYCINKEYLIDSVGDGASVVTVE